MHGLDGCDVPDCLMCEWATWQIVNGVNELVRALVAEADIPPIVYRTWLPGDD